jgi:cytochrome b6-f complex iron-sulfur subunit
MDRKEFFSKALIGGSLLFLAPAFLNSCSKSDDPEPAPPGDTSGTITVDLTSADFNALKTVGGYAYNGNIIIIRSTASVYLALSSVCTHQGCTVAYSSSDSKIACPCHGSMFTTTGAVLQGPATSSLKTYNVKVEGTNLKIS